MNLGNISAINNSISRDHNDSNKQKEPEPAIFNRNKPQLSQFQQGKGMLKSSMMFEY